MQILQESSPGSKPSSSKSFCLAIFLLPISCLQSILAFCTNSSFSQRPLIMTKLLTNISFSSRTVSLSISSSFSIDRNCFRSRGALAGDSVSCYSKKSKVSSNHQNKSAKISTNSKNLRRLTFSPVI